MNKMFKNARAFNQPLDQFVCADRFVYMHEIMDGANSFSFAHLAKYRKSGIKRKYGLH